MSTLIFFYPHQCHSYLQHAGEEDADTFVLKIQLLLLDSTWFVLFDYFFNTGSIHLY